MKNFNLLLLKFCYSIEIGAYLAYRGHFLVTKDSEVKRIAREELTHMVLISRVLHSYQTTPNAFFNFLFYVLGHSILALCYLTPHSALDFVASILEKMNVVSYNYMAKAFPEFREVFEEMQKNELEHEEYFHNRKLVKA